MSDEKVIADVKQPTAEPQGVKTEAVAEDVKQESQSIPYTRFKEVLDSKKSLESEIATLKEAEEAKRKKDLETQGEYKQLLTETETKLEQAVQKAAQWDDYQTARRETLLAQLSESDAAIYGGMPLDKLEQVFNGFKRELEIANLELKRQREDMASYFGFGGTAISGIAGGLSDTMIERQND